MYPVAVPPDNIVRALGALDHQLACEARDARCPCSGRLHWGTWVRKPRGLDLPEALCIRWGLCCGRCRHRVLPKSVLFSGRRVFLKAILLLVVAARQRDRAHHSMARLRRLFGVSAKTIGRWMRAFLDGLPRHPDWQRFRGRLPATVRDDDVPAALLELLSPEAALVEACRIVPDL
ncbi:MAG: hypothetical protein H6953_19555 [Chromatiaceae bacterium]|nr:hypothetical protein [Chromatiaceae bacterium]